MPRALVVHQPTDGGVARHVADLATGLAQRGYEVTLCGPTWPEGASRAGQVEQVELELGRAVGPSGDTAAVWRLMRIVRDVRPDIVHAHSSKAGAVTRLERAFNPGLPVIYSPHLYSFASSFADDRRRVAYREIERALAPLASRVVCVCEAEARLARKIGPAARVRVLYNGIAAPSDGPIDPRIAELARLGPVVCALALLHPRKGVQTLIDAVPAVLASHPDTQFAIWGDGPARAALRDQAERLGVSCAVHFLGMCHDSLAGLRGTSAFVCPSLAEAFPYAILEAMASGLPVVASDVGGIGEALRDGESGILVPAGASKAIGRALVELLADPGRRGAMGAAARERFEQRFTLAQMLDGITRIYGEVSPACRTPAPAGPVRR